MARKCQCNRCEGITPPQPGERTLQERLDHIFQRQDGFLGQLAREQQRLNELNRELTIARWEDPEDGPLF